MKKTKIISFIILFLVMGQLLQAQKPEPEIYKGNELYRKQQFDKAAQAYQEALSHNPKNGIANFNTGNAAFRQNKLDDALNAYDNTLNNTNDKTLQQQAYYNKGVTYSKQQQLEESIDAWKRALTLKPDDKETRENLEKALRELRKKQEEEKKKNEKNKKKEQEKQKQQPKQQKLSQQRVEQLLKALQQKEKEVNDKLNQNKVASPSKPEKDW